MRRILVVGVAFGLMLAIASPHAAGRGPCGLTEAGQWSDPIAYAIDVGIDVWGDVYVSDETGSIHVFTTDGTYQRSFEAASPHGLTVDNQKVYNASWGAGAVQVFDKAGNLLLDWGEWDEDGVPMAFGLPLFIDVDSRGFIYVTDAILGQVRKFSPSGEWVATFGDAATAVSVHGARVYVTNPATAQVDVFTQDGDFLWSFGTFGDGEGEFFDPYGIEVAGGFVYVADLGLLRVQQFSLQGDYISHLFDSDLERVDGVGADARGNVYVTDQFAANDGGPFVTWYTAKGGCT